MLTLALSACSIFDPVADPTPSTRPAAYTKVMVIVMENHDYPDILGLNASAPFLVETAKEYGSAANMDAGYPTKCPSLPAYLLMTSGSTYNICDDKGPRAHPIAGDNIFNQVAKAGLQWRTYAEGALRNCSTQNSPDAVFLVRHTPVVYYNTETDRCQNWDVPMGSLDQGALHDDILAEKLPAYSFVTPDACDDMHGAPSCQQKLTSIGDAWLHQWLLQVMTGPDYEHGHLAIIVTFDEGTDESNHIPTVIISPTTHNVAPGTTFSHCSTLRTAEEILKLPLLGCAQTANSYVGPFNLK